MGPGDKFSLKVRWWQFGMISSNRFQVTVRPTMERVREALFNQVPNGRNRRKGFCCLFGAKMAKKNINQASCLPIRRSV